MSAALPAVVLTPGILKQVSLINIPNVSAVKVTNGTPFDITYSGFGVQGSSIIPAGLEYMLYSHIKNAGYLNLLAVNNAGVTGNGVINMVVYDTGEQLPPGVWPVSVPTQTVSANVSTVQTLSNETSVAGTLVIDMGVPGNTNLVTLYNDGHATWSVLQGGVVHQVFKINTSGNALQLGQSGDNSEVLGGLFVDQNLSVTGTSSVAVVNGTQLNASTDVSTNQYNDGSGNSVLAITPGTTTRLQTNAGGTIAFQVSGISQASVSSSAFNVTPAATFTSSVTANGGFILGGASFTYGMYTNGISRISAGTFTGTGTFGQLINHGLGATPNIVVMTPKAGNSTTTFGADTYTSTQFTAVTNNAIGMAFLAIRF
jgi:hypothetical protein